jgi:hypothetical protein
MPPAIADAPNIVIAADFKIVLRGTPFPSRIAILSSNLSQASGCDAPERICAACETARQRL